ncbi:MAG: hypothetical protein EHM62_02805, partial [Methylococcus sp.]
MPCSSSETDSARRLAAPTVAPGEQSIAGLKGVGAQTLKKLEKLGLRTLQDLLFHLPHRYEDRT